MIREPGYIQVETSQKLKGQWGNYVQRAFLPFLTNMSSRPGHFWSKMSRRLKDQREEYAQRVSLPFLLKMDQDISK